MLNLSKYSVKVDLADITAGDSIASYLATVAGGALTSETVGGNEHLHVKDASAYAEDSAHASGDIGNFILAVRNDTEGSLAGADGDYAPLQVDALGRLRVNADINVNNDFVYAEDSAASSGDLAAAILLVRQDTLATSTSADGDYGHFKSTSLGELYTHDASANASLDAIEADADSIRQELEALSHLEDSAHVSGDAGIMSLAVRNDAGTSLVSANGDYAPLSLDANGNLRIAGSISIASQFAEDSAHTNADSGLHMLAVRKDALSSNVGADGDYASILQWSEGSIKTVDIPNIAPLQQQITVGTTAVALPASSLANRRALLIQNNSSVSIFIGSATVTTSGATGGIEVPKNSSFQLEVGPACVMYAIAGSAGNNIRVLELS